MERGNRACLSIFSAKWFIVYEDREVQFEDNTWISQEKKEEREREREREREEEGGKYKGGKENKREERKKKWYEKRQ